MNNSIELTELRIYPVKNRENGTLAYCVATVNAALRLSGLRIKEGKKGVYVAFPLSEGKDGKKYPVYYPVNAEIRKELTNRILASYVVNHCVDEYQS